MKNYLSSAELKAQARGQLLGHYSVVIWAMLLIQLANVAVNSILTSIIDTRSTFGTVLYYAVSVLVTILLGLFTVGESYLYLKLACYQHVAVSDVFYGFKNHRDKALVILAVITVLTYLCTIPYSILANKLVNPRNLTEIHYEYFLPFCIALTLGCVVLVIVSLLFSQVFFLLLDFPDYSAKDLMSYSIRLMRGNMGRLFYVEMSFLPLMLLGILSCGIGLLWIYPYMNATLANFFLDLVKKSSPERYEQYA